MVTFGVHIRAASSCGVIVSFRDADTQALAAGKRVKRFAAIESVARRKLRQLQIAGRLDDVRVPPGNRLEAMRKVARWVFLRTSCDLFIVPPHRRNPAAQRVYEKAGFVLHPATESARRHRVMELSRRGFERELP